jgi:photosystem II stability/assembly factor-like uncharacterized protein
MRLFCLLAAIAASVTLQAGVNEWTSLGPEGGSIRMLVVDPRNPSTIYAASDGKSFRSSDGGMHWKVTDFPVGLVEPSPRDASTLYVATWGRGIFKSTDAGATWNAVNSGLPDIGFVSSLLIHPRNSSTLYASVAWNTPSGSRAEVFKSVNEGESWSAANSGLPQGSWCCESLAMDPQDPETLYKAIGDVENDYAGLYKTIDGGKSWTRTTAIDAIASGVTAVVIDPQNPSTIYANACKDSGDDCFWTILKSVDQAESWSEANSGLPEGVGLMEIDQQNPQTLYAAAGWVAGPAGLFKTTDGGANWSAVAPGLAAHTLAIDSDNSGTLYAGTASGIWKSTDGGASFSQMNSGVTATNIAALAIDPENPSNVFVISQEEGASSIFKSTDHGTSWSGLSTPAPFRSLTIDPQNSGAIYGVASTLAGGIFKSTDGAASWNETTSGLDGPPYALALDPLNPGTAYASTGINVTGLGIYKTTDGAASWRLIGPGPASHPGGTPVPADLLVIDPQDPRTIYAHSVSSFSQIWKSTDGGVAFGPANSGLPTFPWGGTATIFAFAIDPQNSGTLYAWVPRFDFPPVTAGLFKSINGGMLWEAVSPGLPDGVYVRSLIIDPRNTSILYAGTSTGVLKSTDGGTNWSVVNSGLTTLGVNTLAVDARNTSTLYAGTSGGGVFAITFAPESKP